ncbi:hypothetical protein IV203_035021 [Nitzschia inconspicua]|uniref:Uncharacterized protein n=1 Tax=Nitzschia inconspicua TaxID=303405 RepID=A0A9K3PUF4_9STRA|nr:hypothetical protein IV203_035021 [Nitzschia inconspicua]
MGRKKTEEPPPSDPTGWILDNEFAHFVLMHSNEIKYMCMLGYTFLHGSKLFQKIDPKAPFVYRFINMIFACTGGGTLVPILINAIPVNLGQDSYPIAIFISYLIHSYFPILREVLALSPIFKASVTVLYETFRAYVVTKLTLAAAAAIPPSEFSFPIFGPIFCGAIAGCGGAFLPLNKGLDPIKDGLEPPMFSAFVGAAFFHLFTQLATDVIDVKSKGKVIVAFWFITYAFYKNGYFDAVLKPTPPKATPTKKNN